MPRYAKIILWVCLALVLSAMLVVAVAARFDWNHARPWLNRQASVLADRQVEVRGNLDVRWLWPREVAPDDRLDGWRAWVPWPRIVAENVVIGPPKSMAQAADARNMAEIGHVSGTLNPLALGSHVAQIRSLRIASAKVFLQRQADGAGNWTFGKQHEESAKSAGWKVDLQSLQLEDVQAQVVDASRGLDLTVVLDTLRPEAAEMANTAASGIVKAGASDPPKAAATAAVAANTPTLAADAAQGDPYSIHWSAKGSFNKAMVEGEGRIGAILSLRDAQHPFPLQGEASIGKTRVVISGTITRPQDLAALDVDLKLSGDSMSDLLPIIGVALPVTPPYRTQGHLTAQLEGKQDVWRYEGFQGRVGESDLRGTLEFRRGGPRPVLSGEVRSRLLRFQDLGPLVGADTSRVSSEAAKRKDAATPKGKVLPAAEINTDAWGVMDASVRFTGEKIVRQKDLPLDNIEASVELRDKVLSFEPLNFGVAGGTLANTIRLDGSGKEIHASVKTTARHLKLKRLFPGAESMNASFGELHGNANLRGNGQSIAQMLGTVDGDLQALVSRGTISHFLLEAAGLNVANMIVLKLFGDEQITMNCFAGDVAAKNGLLTIRTMRLETDDMVVDVTGDINLRDEGIDLKIMPNNRTLRIFTLRSPLYARGTLQNPDVGVEKGPVAARAGAAVALGVIATPLAALLPLLNVGTDEATGCTNGTSAQQGEAAKASDDKANADKANADKANGDKASSSKKNGANGGQSENDIKRERKARESWPSSRGLP